MAKAVELDIEGLKKFIGKKVIITDIMDHSGDSTMIALANITKSGHGFWGLISILGCFNC